VTFDHEETDDVGGLATIINLRLADNARLARALAFAWFGGGLSIALLLTGLGLTLAFYGYSYTVSIRPAAEQTAKALADAFERTVLKTSVTGTMALAPNSELVLASDQKVRLDDGSMVKLDPSSTVRVVGDLKIDMPQPTKEQLQLGTKTQNDELPFTSYTIFRSVKFGSGKVVSGWKFDLADRRPKCQYCYYSQDIDSNLSSSQTIGVNGSVQRPPPSAKLSFDFDAAAVYCEWFSGF
jgi:hypothetical protein